ncbi:MAG: hypothetical protein UD455_05875 [Collinsella bouchesdurhonensis]|nr:hypothetical protein [Collinsella bouchesdurhonensis]
MANSKKYLNHLLQRTEITPACSEEERTAADVIARIFTDHGFNPEIQEFTASSPRKNVSAIAGIVLFVATIFMGIGGALGIFGFLLVLALGVLYVLIRLDKISVPAIGANGLSQNVIAYHQASGPLASPRNRPVVVVAHYDSSRADLLSREPFANYRALINKLFPVAMVLPAAVAILRLLPLPGALKAVLWVIAILFSLIPLLRSVAFLFDRFAMPYTTGAICNKSSVAAMLGVMDTVAPLSRADEFPEDVPFEEYLDSLNGAYQSSYTAEVEDEPLYQEESGKAELGDAEASTADEMPISQPQLPVQEESVVAFEQPEQDSSVASEETQADDETVDDTSANDDLLPVDSTPAATDTVADAVEQAPVLPLNAAGNLRFGKDAIRALGMIPAECDLEYDEGQFPVDEPAAASVDNPVVASVDEPVAVPVETQGEEAIDQTPAAVSDEHADAVAVPVPAPAVVPIAPSLFDEEVTEEEEALAIPAVVAELADGENTETDEAADEPAVFDEQVEEQVDEESFDASQTSIVPPIPNELVEDQPVDASQTSIVAPIPDELVEETPLPAASEEQPLVLTGEEDFEEIIPTDDMEIVEADFELIEDEPLPLDEVDQPAEESEDGIAAEDVAQHEADEVEEEQVLPAPDETVSVDVAQVMDEQEDNVEQENNDVPLTNGSEGTTVESTQVFVPAEEISAGGTQAIPAQSQGTQAMPVQHQGTQAMPAQVETVDSLMAQITPAPAPAPRPQRQLNIPSLDSVPASPAAASTQIPPVTPTVRANPMANRSSLFDLPDPSAKPVDPFSSIPAPVDMDQPVAAKPTFTVIDSTDVVSPVSQQQFETIHAVTPVSATPAKKRRGLFGRKKKEETSMSDWLGVDEDFDAKRSGRDIGSWDNFEGDDGWKGGAAGEGSEDELRQAVTSLGDDELLGHDIWFVATGAAENDNAGMKAFLDEHRDKLRGVFIINLKCVGAGQLSMITTEGEHRTLKADRRITGLFSRVASDFHRPLASVEMPYVDTDAHAAMERSLRAMTLAGVEGSNFACAYTEQDHPINLNADNVNYAADLVTEVIRRS